LIETHQFPEFCANDYALKSVFLKFKPPEQVADVLIAPPPNFSSIKENLNLDRVIISSSHARDSLNSPTPAQLKRAKEVQERKILRESIKQEKIEKQKQEKAKEMEKKKQLQQEKVKNQKLSRKRKSSGPGRPRKKKKIDNSDIQLYLPRQGSQRMMIQVIKVLKNICWMKRMKNIKKISNFVTDLIDKSA